MRVWSESLQDGAPIPQRYALARIVEGPDHVTLTDNISPHLAWADLPAGTQSVAVIMVDVSAPTSADDVNQEDREVPSDLPRAEFYHWLLVDLPALDGELREGSHSSQATPGGKEGPKGPHGGRHGANDYTSWFAGDKDMAGTWYGYDGPAPPWNDSIPHEYVFRVIALDVAQLELPETFTAADVTAAITGHILGEGSVRGTYTLNPRLA